MKKFLLVLVVLLVVLAGVGFYFVNKVYNPTQKELNVVVNEETKQNLESKLEIELPSVEDIQSGSLKPTEYKLVEADLANDEVTLLMDIAISNIMPVKNLQVVCNDGYVEMSGMYTLSDEIKESIGSPIPLPNAVAAYITIEISTSSGDIKVNTTGIDLSGIPVPSNFSEQINSSVKSVLVSQGYEDISVSKDVMHVKGNLPSKFE